MNSIMSGWPCVKTAFTRVTFEMFRRVDEKVVWLVVIGVLTGVPVSIANMVALTPDAFFVPLPYVSRP